MKNWSKGIALIILTFCLGTAFAQGPARDKIKTLKVAFITERLQLTPKEAQTFWPIYNAHEDNIEELRRTERLRFSGRMATLQDISDKEASELLTDYMALQQEKQELNQQFVNDLKGNLPAKKIILLFRAEEDFKKRLLQQYRKRRGGG